MNEWPIKTLGDLIHVKHGFAFKGEFFTSDGEKLVLKPGNFPVGGGIRLRPGKDAYYPGSYPPDFELSPGDLHVANPQSLIDPLAHPALVKHNRGL